MIIGNPIIIGGGLTATIVVSAPTGSIVSCTTPDGVVMTVAEVSGTWTFAHLGAYGTYTITSTVYSVTKTVTVLVDMAAQYMVNIPILPSGYQEVEYLQSNGSQYLDTGIKLSNGGVVINTTVGVYTTVTDSYHILAGGTSVYDGSGDNTVCVAANPAAFSVYSNTAGALTPTHPVTVGGVYNIEAKMSNGERYLKVDGTEIARDTPASIGAVSTNMYMFCDHYSQYPNRFRYSKLRLGQTKITQGSTVRHYIPCIRNASNVAGFYDIVEDSFNPGYGGFTAGPNVY